ncbi:hypothetical protein [Desulfonema magnum]|uniref:hypothetical protein n=1 Tax=Desulfonema magnum TaxID=45655 RepID=UPI001A9B0550|nr:hypothetical protein [Desulfonema magnum]
MRKSILSERRTDSPIRSAKILFLQLRKIIFALRRNPPALRSTVSEPVEEGNARFDRLNERMTGSTSG